MKHIFMMAMTIAATLAFTGCGSSSSSNNPSPVIVPNGAVIGTGVTVGSCQVGQVYATGYGCLNRYSCQEGYGWIAGEARCVPGTVVTNTMVYGGTASMTYQGSMQITNADQYALLLKIAGKCDPGIWNFGSMNCDNWMGSPYLRISGYGGLNSTVSIVLGSQGTSWTTGYGSLELWQTGTVQPYNNNSGFVIRGVDYMGRDTGLRVISETGNLANGYSMTATVMYQSGQIATATLNRW